MRRRDLALPDYNRPIFSLMGVLVDAIDCDRTETLVKRFVQTDHSLVWSTPNLNHLVTAIHDDRFRDLLYRSDLSTVDGMPLVLLARLLGIPIKERVAGSSLFERLAKQETERPIRVFLFGGTDEVLKRAASRLNDSASGMHCVGTFAPGFGSVESMSSDEVLRAINSTRPDFLVLALGAKRGHQWIALNKRHLNVALISHLGSVINFAAGHVRRAPLIIQAAGLEWFWRILQEPYLASRYLGDFRGLVRVLCSNLIPLLINDVAFRFRLAAADNPTTGSFVTDHSMTISLAGHLKFNDLGDLRKLLTIAATRNLNLNIDFRHVTRVTPELLGLLLLAKAHQDSHSLDFKLVDVTKSVRREFRLHLAGHLLNGK